MAVLAAACHGQQNADGALAGKVAPYVDGQTLAIFHADLAAFDAAGAVHVLAQFLHLGEGQSDRLQARVVPVSVLAGSLPQGAAADVFVVASASDLASLPVFFVLPLGPGSPAGAISMELRRYVAADLNAQIETEPIAGALVTGSPRTLKRLKAAKPTARREIAEAFQAIDGSAVQMLFVPSADALRAFELLFPNLPESLGGGPTREITGKIVWVAIGVEFAGGQTVVRVVVQGTNAEAATSLADGMRGLLNMLADEPAVRDKIPGLDELAGRLTPETDGARLTLRLNASHEEMAALGSLMLPVLQSVEGMIARRFAAGRATQE